MKFKKVLKISILLFLFAVVTNVTFQACSLKPMAWKPPTKPALVGALASNELLASTQRLDLDGWYGPEDIAIDKEGNLYCGARKHKNKFDEGGILKIDKNGKISTFCNTGSWVAGLHFDQDENLVACDLKRGIIRVNKKGEITVLASEDEQGRKFLIPNDVDVASDGMIYFSNTSAKIPFNFKNARKIIMEARPDGGLYQLNPTTREVKTLIDSSFFGNGVAVSARDEFVLMVDLTKYRVLRYWLKGAKKGTTEVFIDNLPGFPNGISRRKDGSFWLGFSTIRDKKLDKIHSRVGMKKLVYGLPSWLQPKQRAYGIIMHLSEQGQVLQTYYDTTGKFVSEASSIEERDGYIYIGGDLTRHIGKYKLEK